MIRLNRPIAGMIDLYLLFVESFVVVSNRLLLFRIVRFRTDLHEL